MKYLRRLGLSISTFVLAFSLFGFALSGALGQTIRDKETVKSWLEESGFYDEILDTVLNQIKSEGEAKLSGSVDLNNPEIRNIVNGVLNPDILKGLTERIVDGTYLWLEGETATPEYSVDLKNSKTQLSEALGLYASKRVIGLPNCTALQLGTMTAGIDFMAINCRPPKVTEEQVRQTVQTEVANNLGFIPDNYVSTDNLTKDENSNNIWPVQAQSVYQKSVWLPYVFGLLIVISMAGTIFLSSTVKKGLYRAGGASIAGALILGITSILFSRGPSSMASLLDRLNPNQANIDLMTNLLNVAGQDIGRILWWYIGGYIILGIILVLASKFLLALQPVTNKSEQTPEIEQKNKVTNTSEDIKQ